MVSARGRRACRLLTAFGVAAQRVFLAVKQDDFMEGRTGLVRQLLKLLKECQPAQELRDHHVMPGRQVGPRRSQGDRPGEQPRGMRIIAPPAKKAPHLVDVKIQGQRMLIGVHFAPAWTCHPPAAR